MGISYSFMDDCTYGAEDINKVFSKLTTEGVSLFNYSDGDNPLISLNDAVSSYITPGIESYNFDACKVVYDENSETFSISAGNAFMSDGSIVTIDDEGYDITEYIDAIRLEAHATVYVCFYRNVPDNSIDVICSVSRDYYDDALSVKLCSIFHNTVTDARTYAKTKVVPVSSNVYETITIETLDPLPGIERSTPCKYNIVYSGAKYIFFNNKLLEIQHIHNADKTELTYETFIYDGKEYMVAFNYDNGFLEVWHYSNETYGFETYRYSNVLLF